MAMSLPLTANPVQRPGGGCGAMICVHCFVQRRRSKPLLHAISPATVSASCAITSTELPELHRVRGQRGSRRTDPGGGASGNTTRGSRQPYPAAAGTGRNRAIAQCAPSLSSIGSEWSRRGDRSQCLRLSGTSARACLTGQRSAAVGIAAAPGDDASDRSGASRFSAAGAERGRGARAARRILLARAAERCRQRLAMCIA